MSITPESGTRSGGGWGYPIRPRIPRPDPTRPDPISFQDLPLQRHLSDAPTLATAGAAI